MSVDNLSTSMNEASKTYKDLFEKIGEITDPSKDSDDKRSNGNINGTSVMGKMLQYGTETSKLHALKNMLSPRFAKAHQNGDIHIHDLDFYPTKTTTCLQIPLGEMLKNGVWNEHGFLRPPKTIESAGALAAVVIQSSQNQFHGGQSYPNFDFDMAPFVKLSYEKNLEKLKNSLTQLGYDPSGSEKKLEEMAWEQTENDTLQAMEALVHNLNTMHSRAGAQVVFSSINFGLDTSKEGRLVSKCLMKAQYDGLGKHETPIFPILVFKVKDGISGQPGDPNYDLFEQSIEVTAKRLFPNWIFIDAPFNLKGFDDSTPESIAETSCATMGCLHSKEHVYVKLGEDILDLSIKDLFEYCKTGELNNYRQCQLVDNNYISGEIESNKVGKGKLYSHEKEDFPMQAGVYSITHIPTDLTYIGSSSNLMRRLNEHRCSIRVEGRTDGGYGTNDYDLDNYSFKILEITDDYKEAEKKYIQTIPNINIKGISNRYYKQISNTKRGRENNIRTNSPYEIKEAELIDTRKKEIFILDGKQQWVRLENIFKNSKETSPAMMVLQYQENGKTFEFMATEDHPMLVDGKFVRMDQLKIGDQLTRKDGLKLPITYIGYHWDKCESYDVQTSTGTFIASDLITHNCRTRLFTDVNGDHSTSVKRGNASFTTINLPRLGIKAMQKFPEDQEARISEFFKSLDKILELSHDQLLERYNWQCSAQIEEFPYLVNNNAVLGAEEWKATGDASSYIKHYSLSIGFIGLAECLVSLVGKHHGESEEAQQLGLKIVGRMREYCDQKAQEEHLNWSVLGTPSEGLSGRFTRIDKKEFGVLEGITDKDHYTNSSHTPVSYKQSFAHKIEIEAPYHALENAGHICYVELDGDPSKNPTAVKQIVEKMKKEGIGYGAINHPVDRCRDCGYQGCGISECPVCGSENISSICRITGYLVGEIDRWNDGKQDELAHRITHDTNKQIYKEKVSKIKNS